MGDIGVTQNTNGSVLTFWEKALKHDAPSASSSAEADPFTFNQARQIVVTLEDLLTRWVAP